MEVIMQDIKKEDNSKSLGNGLLITQQEMVLIKHSEEVKKTDIYGNLYDCIENYEKLSKRDFEKNIVFDGNTRAVLLNIDNKKTMMSNILNEWYSYKDCDISEAKKHCQLCGRENKYIFYIHNKITDKDLNIGSECVKKFAGITGLDHQRKNMSQKQKEHEQQKRKIEFEKLEGDDIGFLTDAENKFKTFKVVLPYKLHLEIENKLVQLNLAKTSYIKSGGHLNEIFEIYSCLRIKFNELFVEAINHYNRVKNCLLICDSETAKWILNKDKQLWIELAKNNGFFNEKILKNVYLAKYVDSKIVEIKKHIKDHDLKIIQVNENIIKFWIKNNRYINPVIFTISIKKFMETVGCFCLTIPEYTFGKSDLSEINIENTKRNFDAVYNSMCHILKLKGYDFVIEKKTEQAYWKKLAYGENESRWSNHTKQISAMYKNQI
jgi:hypothetical protein